MHKKYILTMLWQEYTWKARVICHETQLLFILLLSDANFLSMLVGWLRREGLWVGYLRASVVQLRWYFVSRQQCRQSTKAT